MKAAFAFLGLALAIQAVPGSAQVSGRIDTLERGKYICETAGDAASRRGVAAPDEGFSITNGSAYTANGQTGSYLRVDKTVTMTSGPKKGSRYAVKNAYFLRKLGDDGKPTGLRCLRVGSRDS